MLLILMLTQPRSFVRMDLWWGLFLQSNEYYDNCQNEENFPQAH